jgi:hypothetical protein
VEIGTLSPSLPEVPFAKAFDNANEAVTYRFFDPLWPLKRYLDIGVEANLARSVKVVDTFTYNVIQTRRAELEVSSTEGKEMVRNSSLLKFVNEIVDRFIFVCSCFSYFLTIPFFVLQWPKV